jgi:hypothetical protein
VAFRLADLLLARVLSWLASSSMASSRTSPAPLRWTVNRNAAGVREGTGRVQTASDDAHPEYQHHVLSDAGQTAGFPSQRTPSA